MICGKEFERINYSHIQKHKITFEEYCERFPDAPLVSEELKKQISNTLTGRTKENDEGKRKMTEKLTGRTKENHEGVRRQADALRGRTKETHDGFRRISEKLTGRTKEEYEYLKKAGEKRKGRTKENHEGVRRMAKKLTGRTKENNESVKRAAERMTGRTKETHEGNRKQSEKMSGRTKENDEGTRKQADALRGRTKENDEGVRKMAETLTGRTGESASTWKGGISYLPYCEKFDEDLKERVRIFFDRKCYICGKSEQEQIDEMIKEGKVPIRKLDVHHVNYDKMVCCNDVKPLFVPLCRSCHSKTHGNREYWEEFFTISLKCLTHSKCFYTEKEIGGEK